MKQERSVEGLRQSAQRKRQQAIENTENGIKQLVKEGRVITFKAVAEVSGVSPAWLYKEPDIKARIEQLREQTAGKKKPPVKERVSDASKDAMIRNLKERIKQLEAKNRDLQKQNEVFAGQVLKARELEQRVKRLEAENNALHQRFEGAGSSSSAGMTATTDLEASLESLGVQLNSSIRRIVQQAPQDIVLVAMESLREAVLQDRVDNPSGFFYRAVTDAWKPNELHQQKEELQFFNEWWELAYQKGFVTAATKIGEVQHVHTKDGQWLSFVEAARIYPIDQLKMSVQKYP